MMPETDTVSVFTIIYIHVAQSSIWHEANTIISIIGGLFYGYTHVLDIALGFEALCTACTIGITVCTGSAVADIKHSVSGIVLDRTVVTEVITPSIMKMQQAFSSYDSFSTTMETCSTVFIE